MYPNLNILSFIFCDKHPFLMPYALLVAKQNWFSILLGSKKMVSGFMKIWAKSYICPTSKINPNIWF
jgi:hypothetical protein